MQLSRKEIAERIPHHGDMCLLDAVIECSAEQIVCRAASHRHADNPLRSNGRLGAACGIEYAAQAMAVHGAMLADPAGPPKAGFLASIRAATLHVSRLDTIADDLRIVACRAGGDAGSVLYTFSVTDGERVLVEGKAAVILNAALSCFAMPAMGMPTTSEPAA